MRSLLVLVALSLTLTLACSEDAAEVETNANGLGQGKFDENADGSVDDTLDDEDEYEYDEYDEDIWTTVDSATTGDTLAEGDGAAEGEDIWLLAKDVNLHLVTFPHDHPAPEVYAYPKSPVDGVSLGGTEFWQKWSGGLNPTYSFSVGSPYGRRCMVASARRWEAVMEAMEEKILSLKEQTNWNGSFYNWNDDFSGGDDPWGDGTGSRLWAWRTSLIKWISQTNQDGSCYLPTLAMAEALVDDCLATASEDEGEIKGCSARPE